jgi:hypothetical protein
MMVSRPGGVRRDRTLRHAMVGVTSPEPHGG